MSAIFMAADPDLKPVRRHQSERSRVPANLTNQPRELPLLLRRCDSEQLRVEPDHLPAAAKRPAIRAEQGTVPVQERELERRK